MAFGFSLLSEETYYKESAATSGYFNNGKWVKGTDITYISFTGLWEPYKPWLTSIPLPQGTKSKDTVLVYSQELLQVYRDIPVKELADIIYLEDPETNTNAQAYVVFDRARWLKNDSYTLLDGHIEYLVIAQEKLG